MKCIVCGYVWDPYEFEAKNPKCPHCGSEYFYDKAMKLVLLWKRRCEAAERYIELIDINQNQPFYGQQHEAYNKWQSIVKEMEGK